MKSVGYKHCSAEKINSILALTLMFLCTSLTHAQSSSNLVQNPSFENNLLGWDQVEPVSASENFRTGKNSIQITGQDGLISQTITVTPNTDYVFHAYIKNYGRIGVIHNSKRNEKRIHASEEWTKAVIEFNSGDSNSVQIYANYYREQGNYDDFLLAPKSSIALSTSALATQCPNMGFLPIVNAFDDGSNDGNTASNVIDGNLNNRWSSKGIGKTITFDLGRVADVSQLDVMWYKSKERISLFSVETSIDGRNWSMVLPDSSSTPNEGYDSHDIENLLNPEAKYVRIVGAGNSTSEWNSISEVKIKGCVN